MRTYYDPEDDSFCSKTDRYERLMELADHLRDERKDREMEEAQDNTFPASSDADETLPVAKSPADAITTLWGVGDGDAAGGEFFDTEDSLRPPTEEDDAAYRAVGHEYAQTARALLTRCFGVMTGREINACQIATGDFDTDEGFDAFILDRLSIQYSREIAEHINQHDS